MHTLGKAKTAELVEKQIEKFYTHCILTGKLSAGSRLHSNRVLAAKWSTSCSSVQRALASLTAAGLIERKTSRGTFVRSRQNRALVGILMGPNLVHNASWYYRALWEEISNEIDSEYLSSRLYGGLSSTEPPSRVASRVKHLEIDQKYFTFAGYIEVATAKIPSDIRLPDIPRVVYDPMLPENDVDYDFADCGREIASVLREKNLKRTWVISTHPKDFEDNAGSKKSTAILTEIHQCGLPDPLSIRIPVNPSGYDVEMQVHDHLMAYLPSISPKCLPKAIVVADDVSMRAVILALLKRGIRIPEDVELFVVTAENTHIYYSVPVYCYTFPTRAVAHHLATTLKARMAGRKNIQRPAILKGVMSYMPPDTE